MENNKIMEKETLKNIFNFLEKNDNIKTPLMGKFMSEMPLTKEELNFKGNLNLQFSKITSLPKGLKVRGNLNLDYSKITSLPEGLSVGGNLDLGATNITSLPRGLKVEGYIDLNGCTNLTSLPEGLKVNTLQLEGCTNLTLLPKGLKVLGPLIIRYTPLKKLSDAELKEMIKPGFIKGKIYR
jgi:hypothetical protein